MRRALFGAALAAVVVLMQGCAVTAAPYQASVDNVELLKKSGSRMVALGSFTVQTGAAGGSSIGLRGNPMKSPVGADYAAYLGAALKQETGLYVAMSEVFSSVSRVNGLSDPKIAQDGITLVLVPDITTQSHSPSLLTWPPTVFTIDVTAALKAPDNRTLKQFKVQGEGRAEFDEFKGDTSLSAKRAAQDMLMKLVKALNDSAAELR